jgi:hypothetical protein
MRTFWLIIFAVVVVGCVPKPSTHTEIAPPNTNGVTVIDQARAIAIARQAVSTNDTWVDRATFEASRDGSGWSVLVWHEPRVPGGHRLVLIDATGRVTAYYRGE